MLIYSSEEIVTKKIKALPINETMCVYKLHTQSTLKGVIIEDIKEGVCDIKTVENWDGRNTNISNGFCLTNNLAIDKYKKYGMYGSHLIKEKWSYEDWYKLVDKKPFTSFSKGQTKEKQFAKLSIADHSLTLFDGTLVSKIIDFDYIYGQIDNSVYDLEKLAEKIYQRSDILFLIDQSWVQGPLNDEQCSKIIKDIPYYNATEDQVEYIHFKYQMNQESYTKMLKEIEKKESFYSYIEKHDLLGINETKKIKVEEIPFVKKKSKFRN